jgi:hypothetical protein
MANSHPSGTWLKNLQQRQHIHQFDLRLKIASSNLEEASQKSCPVFSPQFYKQMLLLLFPHTYNMYPKPDGGFIYCQLILATSCPIDSLIEKIRPSLMQYNLGLWQRLTDCEQVSDIGWLLYSTRHQDEQSLAHLLSSLIGEPIGLR